MKTGVEVSPTSGSKAPASHWGGNAGQTRGSNSTGQGSLAAPSPNLRFPSHRDSGRGISWQTRNPPPHPEACRSCSAPFGGWGGGDKGHRGEVSRRSQKRRDRGCPPSGLGAAAPGAVGQPDPAPPPRRGEGLARAGRRRGAQGSAGVPRPAREATYVCCWGKL